MIGHWGGRGWLLFTIMAFLLGFPWLGRGGETGVLPRFYLSYSPSPSPSDLAAFDWCILDPAAKVDLAPGQALGHVYLAYVSAVEARKGSLNATEAAKHGVPVVGTNEAWRSLLLDVEAPHWLTMMLEVVVPAALAKGYDGVFLDTLDSAHLLPGYSEKTTAALVALVRGIHERYPGKKIVLNRGFELLKSVSPIIQGVLVESVFQTFDAQTGAFSRVSESDSAWMAARIREVQAKGLPVFAVDYVSADQPDLAMKTASQLAQLGCSPFITTPDLQGTNLGPLREIPRKILVVYGSDTRVTTEEASPPIDTLSASLFQAALEWMGYEFDFLDIGHRPLTSKLLTAYAGVIIDELNCQKPLTKQNVLAWLQEVKARKVPILFAGEIPFIDDDIRSEFAQIFGLGGTLNSAFGVKDPTVAVQDPIMMKGERAVEAHALGFIDVAAPSDAEVYLSIKGTDRFGKAVRFDPCFLASWGGVWLDPYIVLRASQASRFFYGDLFALLEHWLHGAAGFPVPDTTTRDGRRIYYSHIDGDGFASLSQLPGHPACAEITRDRILRKYALPVTVSVVEVDIRGWLKTLKKEDSPKYLELARSIFKLPNVQAASHSFSHPFIWDTKDINPGFYDASYTTLAPDIDYPKVDPQREIAGSIDYINKTLLPKGKQVELMLWSGNCRPGISALRLCRELGVENMNGGETIISKLYPSLSGVGPRMAKWGDEMQIFAANQNEFMYANGFQGPHYGGFANVIDTFEMTDKPRRLKPVNLYYHFYSSTFLTSSRALEHIHDWVLAQSLHPITALQFASLVRDAHRTQIYAVGPRSWRIANSGALRTYRLPVSAGTPNMALCKGVSGWRRDGGVLYVHTTGQPLVELSISAPNQPPAAWPHLVGASADVTVLSQTRKAFHFTVAGWDKVNIELGGLPAGISCALTIGGLASQLTADAAGQAQLSVPPGSQIAVDIPTPFAG
jgi:hypothetical protein